MFLDDLPLSYIIYTEKNEVKTIVGIELLEEHWPYAKEFMFGLLPVYVGVNTNFDDLLEDIPEEQITKITIALSEELAQYINDKDDNAIKALVKKYNTLTNE